MPEAAAQEILIVDDNSTDVALFRRILERGGYSVSDCGSGKLALRTIREKAFSLTILDLSLPDVDGFDILRAIRSQVPRPKVLVVSGFMEGALLDAAKALGAAAVLDKATAVELLLVSVGNLLASEN
jgi:CheY-like chemotaxis protein